MNERLSHFALWLWRRTAFFRTAAGLATLAVAFVGLRLLWIHIERPAHLEANAASFGSIRDFYGQAQMNHDGSQFIYVATADDRGRSIFLCDTATGKRRQIIEDKKGVRAGGWNDDFDIYAGPWSPDDSAFICIVSNRLMVCPIDTNQQPVVIDDQPYSAAVWLTSSKIAYVKGTTVLCVAQKGGDGKWEHKIFLSQDVPMTSLTAIGSDAVAWLENGSVICRADFSEALPEVKPVTATTNIAPPAAGLALWLDASKLRQPDQAAVTELRDLSRRRNDAIPNGRPPVFNGTNSPRALNGLSTIHFGWLNSATNGTGLKTRARSGTTGNAPRSMFAVMRHDAGRPMMVSMGDTSAHGALFALEWSERLFLPTGWWADNYIDLVSTNWNLLEVVYDGTGQKGYLNGILRCTASAGLNTVDKEVQIGFRAATGGNDAKAAEGDFAELLVYDRALNNAERKEVEDYLGAKWFGKNSLTRSPMTWYDTGLDGLTGMAYSKETGEFLINCTESGRDSVWRLNTASGRNATPTEVMQGQSVRNAQWAGPDRFVYASRLDTRASINLAYLSGKESKQLLQLWANGTFDWFKMSSDNKQLFLYGNISNAPVAGIWQRDLERDTWHQAVSSSDHPSTQTVVATHNRTTLASGEVTLTIYRPANFDPHKKYPLVLGDTVITDAIYGEPFMLGMAACGATVAVVERPYWGGGIEQWAENVQSAFDQLKADASVDTKRVYLFAASAETQYLSKLVEANTAPWRGLILLNPSTLPDFSKSPMLQVRPKVLLDAGGEEHQEDRFKKYQRDSLANGVVVEFFTHPGETHRMVGTASKLERARILKHFIFEE